MVTGALNKNKKNRRRLYLIKNKIKEVPIKNINLQKIYSQYNSGCLVVLENIEDFSKGLVYDVSLKDKTINLAFKPKEPGNFYGAQIRFYTENEYELSLLIFKLKPEYPTLYKELNKTVENML